MFVSSACAGMGALCCIIYFKEPERQGKAGSVGGMGLDADTTVKEDAKRHESYSPLKYLVYACAFLMMFSFTSYLYLMPLLVLDRFGFGTLETGFISMGGACVAIVFQLNATAKLHQRIGRHGTIILGGFFLSCGAFLFGFTSRDYGSIWGFPQFCVGIFFTVCGISACTPTISALLSRYASPSEQGTTLGINQSL